VAARQQFITPVALTPMVVVQLESGIAQIGCEFLISGATPAAFTILIVVLEGGRHVGWWNHLHVEPPVLLNRLSNKSICTCGVAHVCLMEQSLAAFACNSVNRGTSGLSHRFQVRDNN
jgi:hypothetical protein